MESRQVHIGRDWLYFYFRVDPGSLLEEGWGLFPGDAARAGRHYANRLTEELAPVVAPLTVDVEPWTGPRVGGPLPLQTELVWLLGVAADALGDIVNLAAFAVLVRQVASRVRSVTGTSPQISDGLAIILAADAICDQLRVVDLTLAFVTPLRKPMRQLGELESSWDGYLVGYRSEAQLVIAHVSAMGEVTLTSNVNFRTASGDGEPH